MAGYRIEWAGDKCNLNRQIKANYDLLNFNLVPVQKISHKYLRKRRPKPESESEFTLIAKFVFSNPRQGWQPSAGTSTVAPQLFSSARAWLTHYSQIWKNTHTGAAARSRILDGCPGCGLGPRTRQLCVCVCKFTGHMSFLTISARGLSSKGTKK